MSKKALFQSYISERVFKMNNKDIIKQVLNEADSFQSKSTAELREMLDKELSKSDDETDYGLVDELTTAIIESDGKNRLTVDVNKELDKLQNRTEKHSRIINFPKWAVGLSAACIMLFCVNCISVAAWDMNIISAVIKFTKGGFSVNFGEHENDVDVIELPTSEDDPYGIIAECAKYDIYFETPHYIPDGFVLTDIDSNVNEDYANDVRFIYWNGEKHFSISYKRYWNEAGSIGIPSDHYNISETTVNGTHAIVSKEDNQYTIIYQKGKFVFFMFADGVPYDECEKIIESIK